MILKRYSKLITLAILVPLFISCKPKLQEIKWDYSSADIIGIPKTKLDKIDIDVYIDATTSMEGFALNNSSIYSQFLDQLEASALSTWKKADPKYFKFGEKIKPIDRSEFLTAKSNPQFYREKGVFMKTYIDSVIGRTDPDRLSVLITDLFQDEGDVNTMVNKLKENCFAKGIMVGLVGVESPFKGMVYDVPAYPNGYRLNTEKRPFYAITFGNPYNMELLFESLKTKSFVTEDHIFIFSKNIVKSYEVSLTKTRDSKNVNKKAPRKQELNSFDFSMKKDGKDARFNLEVNITRNRRCADFLDNNINVLVYKKSIVDPKTNSPDSIASNDISIENVKRTGDNLSANIILKNEDDIGNYSYVVYLLPNPLNGLVTSPWIKDFSTEAPIVNTPSAEKTYNLDKFTSRLLIAHSSVSPIYLAKFNINIFKR